MQLNIIGAGLAGCEAALWLADRGVQVDLYEQKPTKFSPAHKSEGFAELICSNSLKAERPDSASGLLKIEMKMMGMFYPLGEIGRIVVGSGRTVIHDARVYRMRPAVRLANAVVAHRMLGGTDEQYEAMEHAFNAWIEANDE